MPNMQLPDINDERTEVSRPRPSGQFQAIPSETAARNPTHSIPIHLRNAHAPRNNPFQNNLPAEVNYSETTILNNRIDERR